MLGPDSGNIIDTSEDSMSMRARRFFTGRLATGSPAKTVCVAERLERRQLLSNTVQVQITPLIATVTAQDLHNLGINMKFADLTGTLTFTGNNLAEQTAGKQVNVTGNITDVSASFSNSTSASSFVVSSKANDVLLDGFTSTGPMKLIDFRPLVSNGNIQMVAAPRILVGDGMNATFNVTQNIPLANFTGGSFTNSQFNFTAPTSSLGSNLNLKFNNLTDTRLNVSPYIKSLSLGSFNTTSPGSGGIAANSAGTISVASNYKADFTFKPTLGLKYTLGNFRAGGTASGNWNVPGATGFASAGLFDSGFRGSFGSLAGLKVGKDFDGSLTAGSLGIGSIGGSMNGASMDFTNPFAANSWNLGSLKIANSINNSTITSSGNLGNINTMFTFGSKITAGVDPSFSFGQPLSSSDYTSWSTIKSFVSDCKSHHLMHYGGSYVGAYFMNSVHLGNIVTDNFGAPFGLAGTRFDKFSFLDNGKTISLTGITSTSVYNSGLQSNGLTPQQLGDFRVLLPN